MSILKEAKNELSMVRRQLSNQLDARNTLQEKEQKRETKPSGSEKEQEFFKKMDDKTVEIFVDSLVTSLAEMELAGIIPEFKDAQDVRDALLAAIRKMYQERGVISKLARKFDRIGSNRILRYARADINMALRK